jgi:hypothetical protein
MKRNSLGRTVNDQQISPIEDEIADDEQYDEAIAKASAGIYKRSWEARVKLRQLDIWIAVGAYLILSGVALVVL